MTSPENYWDQSCSFTELFCLLLSRDTFDSNSSKIVALIDAPPPSTL